MGTVGIILSGTASFVCTTFCMGSLSKYVEGAAAVGIDTMFTFVSNLISSATYSGINKKGTKSSKASNVNAIPWSSPNYSPKSSLSVSAYSSSSNTSPRRNTVACPWMYPDFAT